MENDEKNGITWNKDFSLVTNKFFIKDLLFVDFVTVVVFQIFLMGIDLAANGEISDLVLSPQAIGIIFVVFFLLMLFSSLLMGNKYNADFTVNEDGVFYRSGRREKKISRILLILMLLTKPSKSGSAVLAVSEESSSLSWKEIYKAKFYDSDKVIAVYNSWRTWTRLYCTPENYPEVAEFIKSHLIERKK